MAEDRSFVVMAKPVGSRCNMHCDYCYYLEKGQYSEHERQTRMSYELLEKLIKETICSQEGPVVSFVWHGGEPTIAGLDFYKKVVELERKYLPAGWQVWNNLQTNGFMMNDLWCDFLKENHFDVGVSFDGSARVHDANRHDLKGGGTQARIARSIQRLRAHGIEPDILCTVNVKSCEDPLEVYRAIKETGAAWCQFIPIVVRTEEGGFTKESVTPEGYGQFLSTIFDEWVRHDLGKIDVQLFAETARIMAGGEASLCWMAKTCGRALIAEEDGAIYSCDHFVDDAHRLGMLQKAELGEMANSDFQIAFGNAKKENLTQECKDCLFLQYCNGGCPKDRFGVSADGEAGQYYLCVGLKAFFAHAIPVLEQVMKMSRGGKTPVEIMAALR
uniref:Chondroitin sulfate/heparin utilization regulation protein n=1 Tax=uncultured bacterium Contigcl_1539 TaxID=1393650 RepID=W0FLU1_9BACT|nr:chondroitin sulfate/heparin utilization regulation protein [uncultured bacterium Contigcl_1539]